jgi:hypothetical protein
MKLKNLKAQNKQRTKLEETVVERLDEADSEQDNESPKNVRFEGRK